jgi:hypothetical protein
MSWLFSQALVEEYLVDISSDGEQSAPLNGNPTQQAYCAPDKTMVFSRLSRFGMTYKPLTEPRGEELLTLFRAGFPVKTSAQQEKALESTETDQECGITWRGSWTKYDPDLSLWKTHQCSLLGGLDEFSGTWPQWGLMQNGECWEQQTSALRTKEIASGLLPTPTTQGLNGGSNSRKAAMTRGTWPTPRASDYKGATSADAMSKAAARGFSPNLPEAAAAAAGGGSLNPMWVEWLMGWPLGWTDLKPLGMDKFQQWQQQHGRR